MKLRRAKDYRFFVLVDLLHEQLHTMSLPLFDLDDLVEVGLFVSLTSLDFSFDQHVVGGENILVERGRDLLDLKGRQKTVVDAVFERVGVDGLSKVGIGVDIVLAFWSGG